MQKELKTLKASECRCQTSKQMNPFELVSTLQTEFKRAHECAADVTVSFTVGF